jgi:hypothetical protein
MSHAATHVAKNSLTFEICRVFRLFLTISRFLPTEQKKQIDTHQPHPYPYSPTPNIFD